MSNPVIESNKQNVKKKVIFDLVKASLLVLGTILLFFLPLFRWKEHEISLFSELQQMVKVLKGGDPIGMLLCIFPLFMLICGVVLLVMAIIDVVKKVMALIRFEDSVLQMYDDIVNVVDKKSNKKMQSQQMLWSLFIFVVAYIFINKAFRALDVAYFYMAFVDGVTVFPVIVMALIIVGYIVMAVLSANIAKQIKNAELNDKYNPTATVTTEETKTEEPVEEKPVEEETAVAETPAQDDSASE